MPQQTGTTPKELRTDLSKPLERQAVFSLDTLDDEKRELEISFSSEEPVERYDWWTGETYREILSHKDGDMDLERINVVGVVAYNHDVRNRLPIGSVERAWLDKETNKCRAVLRFDSDEDADKIYQKIKSGTLRGVSFMYTVGQWEKVKEGKKSIDERFSGPCIVGRGWVPYEIGPVAIPADFTVGAGRGWEPDDESVAADSRAEGADSTPNIDARGDTTMDEKTIPAIDEAAIRAEVEKNERERVSEIMAIGARHGVDVAGFIKDGKSVNDVRAEVLDILAKKDEKKPVDVRVTKDAVDNFREAAVAGFGARVGLDVKVEGSNPFRRMNFERLAEECLERAGHAVPDGKEQIFRDAVSMSPDFTNVMENIAHKRLMAGYDIAPTSFEMWTSVGNLSDFRAESRVLVSEFDDIEQVLPAQPYSVGKMSDQKVSISLAKYGKIFCLTWEDMVNDNLGALGDIPFKQGAACRRFINKTVYGILTTNGNMSYDSTALFEASSHKNLASSGAALSVTSLGAAKAAMRKQKNIGSKEYLNITPTYLIVPAELEVTAGQLIASVVDPSKNNATPNPFANKLQVVVEPVLSENSATAWYLAAAPGLVGTVEVAYLDGNKNPYFERRNGFDVDGIEFKVRQVFGAAPLDHKGLYKNPGA